MTFILVDSFATKWELRVGFASSEGSKAEKWSTYFSNNFVYFKRYPERGELIIQLYRF